MVTKWTLLAVSLPVLTLLGGIVRGELHFARSVDWEFEITGYDPRDLVHGRYINYRIDFKAGGSEDACILGESDCCYCLMAAGKNLPDVTRMPCSQAKLTCEGLLGTQYLDNLQRYYVPEAQARRAEDKLRTAAQDGSARAVLSIDKGGRPMLKELRVNGTPLIE